MANSTSALKRIRQTETRTTRNKSLLTRMKSLRKKTLAEIAAGDRKTAQKSFSEFTSAVDMCAKKNVIHKNKAANLKSKTNKHIRG